MRSNKGYTSSMQKSNGVSDLLPVAVSIRNKNSDNLTLDRLRRSEISNSYFLDLQTISHKDSSNNRKSHGLGFIEAEEERNTGPPPSEDIEMTSD